MTSLWRLGSWKHREERVRLEQIERRKKVTKLTKEEWNEVEKKLQSFFDMAKLKCDGYEVTLKLERLDQYKNAIMVYVNGYFKGEWLNGESEEAKRFYKKVTKTITNSRGKAFKKLPKKLQKELATKYSYSYYLPYWTSFGSLKRHLIKENASIELICGKEVG